MDFDLYADDYPKKRIRTVDYWPHGWDGTGPGAVHVAQWFYHTSCGRDTCLTGGESYSHWIVPGTLTARDLE